MLSVERHARAMRGSAPQHQLGAAQYGAGAAEGQRRGCGGAAAGQRGGQRRGGGGAARRAWPTRDGPASPLVMWSLPGSSAVAAVACRRACSTYQFDD